MLTLLKTLQFQTLMSSSSAQRNFHESRHCVRADLSSVFFLVVIPLSCHHMQSFLLPGSKRNRFKTVTQCAEWSPLWSKTVGNLTLLY